MNTTIEKTLHILESNAEKIVAQTPFYLFNKQVFKGNINRLRETFEKKIDSFKIAYSVKTNYAPSILQTAVEEGCFLEIVSPKEMKIAHQYAPFNKIIYNGVIHDTLWKYQVARSGGIVNIENFTELNEINEYAQRSDVIVDVGIRCRISGRQKSRFGIEMNESNISLLKQYKNIRIKGLHCHVYNTRAIEFWGMKVAQLASYAQEFEVEYLDFGSSMYGAMNEEVAKQFNCKIPAWNEYAKEIRNVMDLAYSGRSLPQIIIEPGTPIVANAQSYVTTVKDIKEYGDSTVCVVDGKHLDISVLRNNSKEMPLYVINTGKNIAKDNVADICGNTCLEGDIFKKEYKGKIAIGDIVVVDNIGNYSNSTAPAFITDCPPVLTLDNDKIYNNF